MPDLEPDLHIEPPPQHAAGAKAAFVAARNAVPRMGIRRTVKTMLAINQADGFDCPGCAWPEPENRGHLEFCENGAKAVAEEATRKRITHEFFTEHTISDLLERSDFWLGQQGRLTEPMYRAPESDRYVPITWDGALDLIATRLNALPSPNAASFYTSGRTSNEAAFVYQLFVRAFGTNNLPDCSNMCHESSGAALVQTIGIGKGSVTLDDIHHSDLIFVVGQNPGTNHPRMLTALEEAKHNGARIIAVNPLPEAGLINYRNPQRIKGVIGLGTKLADLFLNIRVNGDLALFAGVNRLLIEAGDIDRAFIDEYCSGYDEFAQHALAVEWPDIEESTGLENEAIQQVAEWAGSASKIIVCWAMGLTQHRNSVATIREVVNFALLRGAIGRPGAGLCPVRGHSNVQGDRTMGVWERPTAAFLDALQAEFSFEPPRAHGRDVVNTIRAMATGDVRVFMAMGGNFLSATPDTAATAAALKKCDLTVQVSTKLNRSHLITGHEAVILPCFGRTDRDQPVSVEDSMSIVHLSQGSLEPASEHLRSEVAVVCGLARRALGPGGSIPWEDMAANYDLIRDRISRVITGFHDFNERVRQQGGFVLPHEPRDERVFPTASGKAMITINPIEVLRVPAGRLILQTIRSHDQYNTTIYGLDDRYRGIHHGRRVVLVNPSDLADLGLSDGDHVDLVGEYEGVERRAPAFRVVSYATPPGCCAAYYPEANVLVPLDSTAVVSNTPTSKSVVVRLEQVS